MDMQSATTGIIALALSKAQFHFEGAIKDKANPFFKSKYSDINSVIEACKTALHENELAFSSRTELLDGKWVLIGSLLHSSGEFLRTMIPILSGEKDMQSFGSSVTYSRRFALLSLCNISTEDDDGEASMDRISEAQILIFESILAELGEVGLREKVLKHLQVKEVKFMTKPQFDNTMRTLKTKLEDKKSNHKE